MHDETTSSGEEDLPAAAIKEYLCTSLLSGRELSVADVTVERLVKEDMASFVNRYELPPACGERDSVVLDPRREVKAALGGGAPDTLLTRA